ncbi:MAG: DUF2304 domain-containing protein [Gemmatimonadales bacterium]|nr:DUF2304 domain-containing protein [Gemmatimonadales bacterium]
MASSQVILTLLIGMFVIYLVRMRSTAIDRLTYLLLAGAGIFLVLNPDLTNQAAAMVGIGRGADLMFYFFIVFCLFHFATTAATLRRLQRDLATMAREMALLRSVEQPHSDS